MKPVTTVAALIFAVVALVHLSRLVLHWSAVLGGWEVPMWISGFGCVVPALLSFLLLREARR